MASPQAIKQIQKLKKVQLVEIVASILYEMWENPDTQNDNDGLIDHVDYVLKQKGLVGYPQDESDEELD